mgnify:CR=1 FL=1
MKSIDLIEDISFPAQRNQLIKNSSAYKAAVENDIDTDLIEGKQPDKNSGVVKTKDLDEVKNLEKLYTWHFMWSKFYYYRKHYSLIWSLLYFTPIILRIKFRIIFHTMKGDKKNIDKYKTRWSGLINSINGKKSYLRVQN